MPRLAHLTGGKVQKRQALKLMIFYMIMLDTSFVVAYLNTRDQNNPLSAKTAKILADQNPELYVTNYIFGEIVTVIFLKLKNLKKAIDMGKMVLRSCNLVHVDKYVFEYAWKIFSEQKLRLSFVDCTTIATMEDQKIRKIATFDSDFIKVKGIEVFQA